MLKRLAKCDIEAEGELDAGVEIECMGKEKEDAGRVGVEPKCDIEA
jgi:hypothetical protein